MHKRIVGRIAWLACGAAGAALLATSSLAAGRPKPAPASNPSLVFITTTKDCRCTLDRCLVGRQEVDRFLRGSTTKFDLQVVDLGKTPSAARQHEVLSTPVALLRDTDGKTVARFETFFSEADLRRAWSRHVSSQATSVATGSRFVHAAEPKKAPSASSVSTSVAQSPKVTFLELGSVGCKPCDAMQPVMESVRQKYGKQVTVTFHDVRRDPEAARRYRVLLIPTQVLLDGGGREVFRHEGFLALEHVEAVLRQLGVR